jgi:hypothetical protein
VRRGRGSIGEHRPQAVLTETKVRGARRRREWGWSYARIGAWAGVHEITARLACIGRTWKHVE